jgi:hypothetical protein
MGSMMGLKTVIFIVSEYNEGWKKFRLLIEVDYF